MRQASQSAVKAIKLHTFPGLRCMADDLSLSGFVGIPGGIYHNINPIKSLEGLVRDQDHLLLQNLEFIVSRFK